VGSKNKQLNQSKKNNMHTSNAVDQLASSFGRFMPKGNTASDTRRAVGVMDV
jgi:hypothetical protein